MQKEIAGLPSEVETDDIESRMFNVTVLRMQLALAQDSMNLFEPQRQRLIKIVMLLKEKSTIPVVKVQLEYLASMQESGFWKGINLNGLEELRLRRLVSFFDKKKRKVVYTDFKDEVMRVRDGDVINMPKMTGAQYGKKIKDYLRNHLDYPVIRRLRSNLPFTATDLQGLEKTLSEIGEKDGPLLLTGLLAKTEAPSLTHFVRAMLGWIEQLYRKHSLSSSLTKASHRHGFGL